MYKTGKFHQLVISAKDVNPVFLQSLTRGTTD